MNCFSEDAEILALLASSSLEQKDMIKNLLNSAPRNPSDVEQNKLPSAGNSTAATSLAQVNSSGSRPATSPSRRLPPTPPALDNSSNNNKIDKTTSQDDNDNWSTVKGRTGNRATTHTADKQTVQHTQQQQGQARQQGQPNQQSTSQSRPDGPRNHQKYGLVVGHNLDKADTDNRQILIDKVLKFKPAEAQVSEIKLTRKNDILVIAKGDHDFNLLLNGEKWDQSQHRFFPRLGMADNMAKVVYVKSVDHNTDIKVISEILNEKNISHSNVERVTSGPDKSPTTCVRLILHSQKDLEHLCKEGMLFSYKRHAVEKHAKVKVIQCNACGKHGHVAANCLGTARCIKCGDAGHTKNDCTVDIASITCFNCKGNHAANFSGCKEKLKIQRKERRKIATYADAAKDNLRPIQSTVAASSRAVNQQTQNSRPPSNVVLSTMPLATSGLVGSDSYSSRAAASDLLSATLDIVVHALKEAVPSVNVPKEKLSDVTLRLAANKYINIFSIDRLSKNLNLTSAQTTAAITPTVDDEQVMSTVTSNLKKRNREISGESLTSTSAIQQPPLTPELQVNGIAASSLDPTITDSPKTPSGQQKLPKRSRNNRKTKDQNVTIPSHQQPLPPPSPEVNANDFGMPGDQPTKEQLNLRRRLKGIVPLPATSDFEVVAPHTANALSATTTTITTPTTTTMTTTTTTTSMTSVGNSAASVASSFPALNLASTLNYENGFLIPGAAAAQSTSLKLANMEGASLATMTAVNPLYNQNG